jgi:DNA-binding FadR family transcriptional regulator
VTELEAGPVKRRKLYEEIVSRISEAITEGRFQPGDQLPSERELQQRFQVGRTSIREALFALQRMGLIAITNGERARVTQPTPDTLVGDLAGAARILLNQPDGIRHFQQARSLFEMGLARFAAEHATEENILGLRKALEANRLAVDNGKLFDRTDVAFHFEIAKIASNPIFTALHSAMASWLIEQRTTSGKAPGSNRAAVKAHERILHAIDARDPQGAEDAMKNHLDEVQRNYWKAVARLG